MLEEFLRNMFVHLHIAEGDKALFHVQKSVSLLKDFLTVIEKSKEIVKSEIKVIKEEPKEIKVQEIVKPKRGRRPASERSKPIHETSIL